HMEYAIGLNALAGPVEDQGRLDEAQAMLERAVRIAHEQVGDEHPRTLIFLTNLSRVRIARGDAAATEETLRQVLRARERLYPAGNWRIAQTQSLLAAALLAEGRYADAEPLMLAADRALQPIAGTQGRERADNRARLASLYLATERPQLAAQ